MTAKTVRSVVEDCYKSREVIGGADKWNELIDKSLADIEKIIVPEYEELFKIIEKIRWEISYRLFKKGLQDIDIAKEVATAIRELIEQRLK